MRASLQAERSDDHGHLGLVAIVADTLVTLCSKSMPGDGFEKAMHEVLVRLLAVGDDVDPGIFLFFQPKQRGIALGSVEISPRVMPLCPKFAGFSEPERFRKTAGKGRGEHDSPRTFVSESLFGNAYRRPSFKRRGRARLP